VFEHPRNFREKLDTQKQITQLLLFMPSTSLEMHRNRFRPGLCPGPHSGSIQRSLRPLAGRVGARRVLPKNPTLSLALRALAIQAMLCRPPTPPKINPSYGLEKKHSPTQTHRDHRTSFIIFLHLQRSIASSLFILRA